MGNIMNWIIVNKEIMLAIIVVCVFVYAVLQGARRVAGAILSIAVLMFALSYLGVPWEQIESVGREVIESTKAFLFFCWDKVSSYLH